MPYWLESDTFADEPVWPALANGSLDLEDRLQAAYCRMMAKASLVRRDGYLHARTALEACRGRRRVLELLCSSVLDQPPLLHRQGDECECLGERWVDGYTFRIHRFLKKNPARSENDRHRAKAADRKDHRLRALVYQRDGGCCRYCRSGPLPTNGGRNKDRRKVRTYDHVDPDHAAGPDGENYVVACDRCNRDKDDHLPHEADMVLLPPPSEGERLAWLARDLLVFDRPEPSQDRSPLAPETLRDGAGAMAPGANADGDPAANPAANPDAIATPEPRPDPAAGDGVSYPEPTSRGAGSGRAPARSQPRSHPDPFHEQPPRTASNPDIYHRRSRASPAPPPVIWPEGYTRERPGRPSEHDDQEGPAP